MSAERAGHPTFIVSSKSAHRARDEEFVASDFGTVKLTWAMDLGQSDGHSLDLMFGRPPITPQGVLVSTAAPETPEWFAARRGGITGTDLPKLLGDSKYGNALSVHLDKLGQLPPDPAGEAALWGQHLEDVVAREWARRNGVTVEPVGVIKNRWCGWMRASLDRLVVGVNEGLEVKTRSAYLAHRYTDGLPDDVLAQVHWGLLVTGLDRMHVAVLIGGQELRQFTVERDPHIEILLATVAGKAWRGVREERAPDVPADGDGVLLGLLDRLYGQRAGDTELDPDDVQRALDLALDYRAASADGKHADEVKTLAKTELVRLLGGGDRLLADGQALATYRAPAAKQELTAKQAVRLAKDRPALWAALAARGYVTTTTPSPRFTLSKETRS